ncbi:MAG: DNA-directed RNA polymerase subunit omega [Eubacterium sp.]|nr:DNA-directed RNA polymerase subunit omega [Eubacterium sp.]
MLYPSINEIKHKADSRYTLVILAAKRARDIIDGKPPLVDCKVNRPVSIAAREINEDMIKVRYPEDKPAEAEEESEAAAEGEETEAEEAEENDAADAEAESEDAEAAEDAADEAESGDAEAAPEDQAEEE